MAEKMKTGTTCMGITFKDGVILAADRRATGGLMKNDFVKVFPISKTIVSTMAGTASSCQMVIRALQKDAKLLELKNERLARVSELASIANQYQYSILRSQGEVVSLLIGGYDKQNGFSLFDMGPDGTMTEGDQKYAVDGSGSVFIKGLFDMEYKHNMSEKEALLLIEKAFTVSFNNDNASGGGFIAKVITKDGVSEIMRKVVKTELVNE